MRGVAVIGGVALAAAAVWFAMPFIGGGGDIGIQEGVDVEQAVVVEEEEGALGRPVVIRVTDDDYRVGGDAVSLEEAIEMAQEAPPGAGEAVVIEYLPDAVGIAEKDLKEALDAADISYTERRL